MASLNKVGDGLLGTFLSWEQLEKDFQAKYGQDAKFGPNKSIVDVSKNKVLRLKLLTFIPRFLQSFSNNN